MLSKLKTHLKLLRRGLRATRDSFLLRDSGLFNTSWYLDAYPDVAQSGDNPLRHYLLHGGQEGRDPGPGFSSAWYLETHGDVRQAGINPLVHYLRFGRAEGRRIQPSRRIKLNLPSAEPPRGKGACDFFFIVGTGRCGSTLLAQVLNAHSKICVPAEIQIAFEYSGNGPRLAEVFASGAHLHFQAGDYIRLVQDRCPHDLRQYYDYVDFLARRKYPALSLREFLTDFYTDIACSQGKTLFAEQTPWYGQNLGLLHDLFPRAKFVHLIRDGRDVATSYARTPWWHPDPRLNLERWEREVNKIEADAALLPKGAMRTFRYEDLILHPADTVAAVCDFLGVAFEASMLDPARHLDYKQFESMDRNRISSEAYRKWDNQKQSAFFPDSVLNWKRNPKVDFGILSEAVMETLSRFGYEVPPATPPSP